MAMKRNKPRSFRFRNFSRKQLQILTWWIPGYSPYADHDMIIADGSVRSGKTIAMITGFILWSQKNFENEAFIIASKSAGALKRNILRPMLQILQTLGLPSHYDRQENLIEIGSNTYYLFGANNEASQDVLQGLTAAGALADEAALFPESFWTQMQARCSVRGAKIWANCNPGPPRHWLKADYIDQAADRHILHLHLTMRDNLSLAPDVRERYERAFRGIWYKRFILGLWVAAEGAIYDMLDLDRHVVGGLICPVKVMPDRLQGFRRYAVGVDYGTASVTTFWLLGIGVDNRLYFVDRWRWDAREKMQSRTDIELVGDLITWLRKNEVYPGSIHIPNDAASLLAQAYRQRTLDIQAGRRSYLAGITAADQSPGSVLDGIRDIASLLAQDRLLFAPHLVKEGALDEWISFVWDPKFQEQGIDKVLKANDHDPDGGRYAVTGSKIHWYRNIPGFTMD